MYVWIMTPQKTLSPHDYYLGHVANKDVIAMPNSNEAFYVWNDYHINLHHQHNLMIT